jgi:hypothetical protein
VNKVTVTQTIPQAATTQNQAQIDKRMQHRKITRPRARDFTVLHSFVYLR